MLTYFVNRAGRALSANRRAELQGAKDLLSKRTTIEGITRQRDEGLSNFSSFGIKTDDAW
jgi:hypothetical protein